ncbi:hypothetical protein [Nocardioides sp. SYSU D00065]|uniref:hypothetical protein n=1 Tax=Nocardioides sp. SYSU D00065 TaxID=2817378 RepID=UPI001B3382F2|nr:hypothetical protein [Nocardioides sp. SYSU D00065]
MRRIIVSVTAAAMLPLLVGTGGAPATGASVLAVKKVVRAYGGAPVLLEARQGVDVAFRARRGDRVLLEVRSRTSAIAPCFGTQTLADGRGRRTARIDGSGSASIMRVRTTGRVVLRFRGVCSTNRGQTPHDVRVQLTKVRLREVERDGRTSVRGARRGFLDVAYVRVGSDGRDTLTLRSRDGSAQQPSRGATVLGDRIDASSGGGSISVEAGQRYALDHSIPRPRRGPRLAPGTRVGLVVEESGYAESLRAREHRVELDDPAITLPAEPGREHVLSYAATAEDRPYVIPVGTPVGQGSDLDDPWWSPWQTYSGFADPDDPARRRTVFASDPDGGGPEDLRVRVRRTVRVPDLVVGGEPVTFASTDPGTRFVTTIPAHAVGPVRLSASDVSTTGRWQTWSPPVVCSRDCSYPGLSVGSDDLVADGYLFRAEPHELQFTFEPGATGSVTLTLTDVP